MWMGGGILNEYFLPIPPAPFPGEGGEWKEYENRRGMDQVFIKDLLVRGVIGITERERHRPQDILINVTIFTDITRAAQTDDINDCVDYSKIAKKLMAHSETIGRETVEALAADLARLCLEERGVQGVRVRVDKPGAVRFSRSVGVEIERFREPSS